MKRLLRAPFTLKKTLLELISAETGRAAAGEQAQIIIKVNAVTDPKVIRALYRASIAGVKIDLIVRGMCCLRPGVPGVSQNIRVRSIVGRFLEHSRAYWFHNAGEPLLYLASADLMERNLDRRVETGFPIEGKKLQQRVKKELDMYMADNANAWILQADGSYVRATHTQPSRDVQVQLLEKLAAAPGQPS